MNILLPPLHCNHADGEYIPIITSDQVVDQDGLSLSRLNECFSVIAESNGYSLSTNEENNNES